MTAPEMFPPPGFYRIDEAYRRWMDARFGEAALHHAELMQSCCKSQLEREAIAARFAEIDNARLEFTAELRERRESVNVISPNGTRHEIPDTAWDDREFPDLLALYKTLPPHAPMPFGSYAGGIIVIATAALDEWTKGSATASASEPPEVEAPVKWATKAELKAEYKKRVENWTADKTPSENEDWEFLKTLSPNIPRTRVRELRRDFAPPKWKAPGPKNSRH